jgi:LEA14-like dessication related protein
MERTFCGILLVCFACACLGGCTAPLREPNVTVSSITLTGISLTSISITTGIRVENPNPVGITITNLSFDLFYETDDGPRYLGHGGRENLTIPKENTTGFDIPVGIGSLDALRALVVLAREGSLPLVVRGTATADLRLTTVQIPFEKRQVVP